MIPNIDKASINATAGVLAKDVDRVFTRVQQWKAWFDTQVDATLISQYGYVQADIDILRSAAAELEQLRTIYQGTVNLAVAKDFRAFSKQTYAFGSV